MWLCLLVPRLPRAIYYLNTQMSRSNDAREILHLSSLRAQLILECNLTTSSDWGEKT